MKPQPPLRMAIAVLVFCIIGIWFSQRNQTSLPAAKTRVTQTGGPEAPRPDQGDAATKSQERSFPAAATVKIGAYAETKGSPDGLSGELARASRVDAKVPEGRRYRFSQFPDLRKFQEGEAVEVTLPDGRIFPGKVNWSKPDEEMLDVHRVSIGFTGDKGGLVMAHQGGPDRLAGHLLLVNEPLGWTVDQERDGSLWLVERLRSDMICDRSGPEAARSAPLPGDGTVTGSGSVAPMLNSRPSATAVLLLDFDGQPTTTYPDWPESNPGGVAIAVPHSGLTADQMTLVWRRVAEDFIQFNINVTTDPAKYTAAGAGNRMRCIIRGGPQTNPDFSFGLAWVSSFSQAGTARASNVPCWVDLYAYTSDPSTVSAAVLSSCASNISHEIGHTLGLAHDGDSTVPDPDDEYYSGHGTVAGFRWGAVMGSPYRSGTDAWDIIQWAKNDYPGANNPQDDLAIIANATNGFGYAADESTGYISSLNLAPTGTYQQLGGEGVVANLNDLDWWAFQVTTAGNVRVEVEPADEGTSVANLDCGFRIENNLGQIVASGVHIQDSLSAFQTVNLSPGLYHVVAYGTGNRQFSDKTGYNDYGSTGRYLVTVDLPIPPDTDKPVLAINAPANNVTLSSLPTITGTASDVSAPNSTGLATVKLNIYNNGEYWTGSTWTATQTTVTANLGIGDGWSYSNVPTGTNLREGLYAISAFATDNAGNNSQAESGITNRTVTIDKAPPNVGIEPFANNSTIFNLDDLRIHAPDAVAVSLILQRQDGGTTMYWSGTNWSSTLTYLPTALNAGKWYCTQPLPNRANWPVNQQITIFASAADAANNAGSGQINVSRSAQDNTAPVVTVNSPANGVVITDQSLPLLQGDVADPESGIASVTLSLARFAPGGVEFWNGSTWTASAANLPLNYDAGAAEWTGPNGWSAPSGSQLANMGYSIQVTATNREIPAATTGSSSTFTVDYHPTYTWTGYTMRDTNYTNDSNSWGVAENWSPYGVPGPNDIAIIGNGDTVTSTISRSVYGMKLQSGTLSFDNGPGPLGTLTTSKSSEWTGGTLYGIWDVASGGTLALAGGGRQLWVSSQIRNAGTVTWSSGVTLGRDSCTVTNLPGATWILAATGDSFDNYNPGNHFINQGVLRQTSVGNVDFNDWYFTLGGEIQKQGGFLVLNASSTVPDGTQFTGNGSFKMISSTMTAGGNISNPTGLFEFEGGTLSPVSTATLSGTYRWSGGNWSGTVQVPAGSDLSITGSCQLNPSAILNNSGTVHWNSASPLLGRDSVRVNNLATGIWRLETTGSAFTNYNGGNIFLNQGIFEKTAAGQTDLVEWTYQLPAQTKIHAGTLRIAADSSFAAGAALSGAGTLDIAGGNCSLDGEITSSTATLKFSGAHLIGAPGAKIQGNWIWSGGTISGTIEVPASRNLTLNGWYQLNPGASMVNKGTVVWQGPNPLIGRDSVTVTNMPGATWEFAVAGDAFANYNGNNNFYNQGLLKRSAPSGDVLLDEWIFHHSGVANATAGTTVINTTLNLLAGGSFTGAGAFKYYGLTTLKGATTFTASCDVSGGDFVGEPAGLVQDTLQWTAGTFHGLTKVAAGAKIRIVPGGKTLWVNATIDASGEILWEGGDLTGREASRFVIRNGAFLRISGIGTFGSYNPGNQVVIESGGSMIKTNAGDNVTDWAINNDGTASVNAGTLILHGGGSSSGAFAGNSGGIVRFVNGTQTLKAGAALSGGIECTGGALLADGNAGGRIDMKGGTLGGTGSGVFSFGGASKWTGGWITGNTRIPNGAALTVSGPDFKTLAPGATMVDEAYLEWAGGHSIQGRDTSTIDVRAGATFRLTADGDLFSNYNGGNRLLLSGVLEKTNGSDVTFLDEWLVEGNGTFRPQVARIDFYTTVNLLPGADFEGAGKTRFAAGNANVQGTSTLAAGSTVEFTGASINGHADGSAFFSGGNVAWTAGWINGVTRLGANTTISGPSEKVVGVGAELRNSGTMTISGTGQLTGRDTSTLRNLAGGTLTCTGTNHLGNYNDGNRLINEGTMNIGGPVARQTLEWAFQQAAGGVLALEVSGANAATPQFDILQCFRAIQLAGTLQVTKTGGYAPAADTTFAFLTGSSVTGTFTTVQAPGFTVEYAGASATLRAGASGMTYAIWSTQNGLAGANGLNTADPDYDGIVNFLEYAFNTNPNAANPVPVTSTVETISSQKWITLHYRRWQDRVDAGVTYQPQRSANLSTWDGTGIVDEADPGAAPVAGSEARRCRVAFGSGKNFLKVSAE